MKSEDMIAVIGHGSIGKRHASLLRKLECEVLTVDPNGGDVLSLAQAPRISAAVICTPAESHVSLAFEAVAQGAGALFIEKPVAASLLDGDRLRSLDVPIVVGYQFRCVDALWYAYQGVNHASNRGLPLEIEFGSDLRQWHPGVDYRTTPYAKSGILLEASHELDLALWMLGPLEVIGASVSWSTDLETEGETEAWARLHSTTGRTCEVSLSMHGEYRRSVRAGDAGVHYGFPEAEQGYMREMAAFAILAHGGTVRALASLEDGLAALKLVEAIKAEAVPLCA